MRISRSRIFCTRTQGSRIFTSISLIWSYKSHPCILYLVHPIMTLFGLKTEMWLIASSQIYIFHSKYWILASWRKRSWTVRFIHYKFNFEIVLWFRKKCVSLCSSSTALIYSALYNVYKSQRTYTRGEMWKKLLDKKLNNIFIS